MRNVRKPDARLRSNFARLIALTLFIALAIGLFIVVFHRFARWRSEQLAVERLLHDPDIWSGRAHPVGTYVPSVPDWIARLLPSNWQERSETAKEMRVFGDGSREPVDLSILERLPNVQYLELVDLTITDANVASIIRLRQLRELRLVRPIITRDQAHMIATGTDGLIVTLEDAVHDGTVKSD